MKTIDELRKGFEEMPNIKERIERSKLKYSEDMNYFSSPEWDSQTCCDEDFVGACWWMYQELNK